MEVVTLQKRVHDEQHLGPFSVMGKTPPGILYPTRRFPLSTGIIHALLFLICVMLLSVDTVRGAVFPAPESCFQVSEVHVPLERDGSLEAYTAKPFDNATVVTISVDFGADIYINGEAVQSLLHTNPQRVYEALLGHIHLTCTGKDYLHLSSAPPCQLLSENAPLCSGMDKYLAPQLIPFFPSLSPLTFLEQRLHSLLTNTVATHTVSLANPSLLPLGVLFSSRDAKSTELFSRLRSRQCSLRIAAASGLHTLHTQPMDVVISARVATPTSTSTTNTTTDPAHTTIVAGLSPCTTTPSISTSLINPSALSSYITALHAPATAAKTLLHKGRAWVADITTTAQDNSTTSTFASTSVAGVEYLPNSTIRVHDRTLRRRLVQELLQLHRTHTASSSASLLNPTRGSTVDSAALLYDEDAGESIEEPHWALDHLAVLSTGPLDAGRTLSLSTSTPSTTSSTPASGTTSVSASQVAQDDAWAHHPLTAFNILPSSTNGDLSAPSEDTPLGDAHAGALTLLQLVENLQSRHELTVQGMVEVLVEPLAAMGTPIVVSTITEAIRSATHTTISQVVGSQLEEPIMQDLLARLLPGPQTGGYKKATEPIEYLGSYDTMQEDQESILDAAETPTELTASAPAGDGDAGGEEGGEDASLIVMWAGQDAAKARVPPRGKMMRDEPLWKRLDASGTGTVSDVELRKELRAMLEWAVLSDPRAWRAVTGHIDTEKVCGDVLRRVEENGQPGMQRNEWQNHKYLLFYKLYHGAVTYAARLSQGKADGAVLKPADVDAMYMQWTVLPVALWARMDPRTKGVVYRNAVVRVAKQYMGILEPALEVAGRRGKKGFSRGKKGFSRAYKICERVRTPVAVNRIMRYYKSKTTKYLGIHQADFLRDYRFFVSTLFELKNECLQVHTLDMLAAPVYVDLAMANRYKPEQTMQTWRKYVDLVQQRDGAFGKGVPPRNVQFRAPQLEVVLQYEAAMPVAISRFLPPRHVAMYEKCVDTHKAAYTRRLMQLHGMVGASAQHHYLDYNTFAMDMRTGPLVGLALQQWCTSEMVRQSQVVKDPFHIFFLWELYAGTSETHVSTLSNTQLFSQLVYMALKAAKVAELTALRSGRLLSQAQKKQNEAKKQCLITGAKFTSDRVLKILSRLDHTPVAGVPANHMEVLRTYKPNFSRGVSFLELDSSLQATEEDGADAKVEDEAEIEDASEEEADVDDEVDNEVQEQTEENQDATLQETTLSGPEDTSVSFLEASSTISAQDNTADISSRRPKLPTKPSVINGRKVTQLRKVSPQRQKTNEKRAAARAARANKVKAARAARRAKAKAKAKARALAKAKAKAKKGKKTKGKANASLYRREKANNIILKTLRLHDADQDTIRKATAYVQKSLLRAYDTIQPLERRATYWQFVRGVDILQAHVAALAYKCQSPRATAIHAPVSRRSSGPCTNCNPCDRVPRAKLLAAVSSAARKHTHPALGLDVAAVSASVRSAALWLTHQTRLATPHAAHVVEACARSEAATVGVAVHQQIAGKHRGARVAVDAWDRHRTSIADRVCGMVRQCVKHSDLSAVNTVRITQQPSQLLWLTAVRMAADVGRMRGRVVVLARMKRHFNTVHNELMGHVARAGKSFAEVMREEPGLVTQHAASLAIGSIAETYSVRQEMAAKWRSYDPELRARMGVTDIVRVLNDMVSRDCGGYGLQYALEQYTQHGTNGKVDSALQKLMQQQKPSPAGADYNMSQEFVCRCRRMAIPVAAQHILTTYDRANRFGRSKGYMSAEDYFMQYRNPDAIEGEYEKLQGDCAVEMQRADTAEALFATVTPRSAKHVQKYLQSRVEDKCTEVGWEFISACVRERLPLESVRVFNSLLDDTKRQLVSQGSVAYDGVVVTRENATLIDRMGVSKDVFAKRPKSVDEAYQAAVRHCRYNDKDVLAKTAAVKQVWDKYRDGGQCVRAESIKRQYCSMLADARREARRLPASSSLATVHANSDAVMACVSRGLDVVLPHVLASLHSSDNPFAHGRDYSNVWTADSLVSSPAILSRMAVGDIKGTSALNLAQSDRDLCIDYCRWQRSWRVVESTAAWVTQQCQARVQQDGVITWSQFAAPGETAVEEAYIESRCTDMLKDLQKQRFRYIQSGRDASSVDGFTARLFDHNDFDAIVECAQETVGTSVHSVVSLMSKEDKEVDLAAVRKHPYALHGAFIGALAKCYHDISGGISDIWSDYAGKSQSRAISREKLGTMLSRVVRKSKIAAVVSLTPSLMHNAPRKISADGQTSMDLRALVRNDAYKAAEAQLYHGEAAKVFDTCLKHTIPSGVNAILAFFKSRHPSSDVLDNSHWAQLDSTYVNNALITTDIVTYNSSVALTTAQRLGLDQLSYAAWARRQLGAARATLTPLQPWGMCAAPEQYSNAMAGDKHAIDVFGSALVTVARHMADECNSYVLWEDTLHRLHKELHSSANAQGIAKVLYGPKRAATFSRDRRHTHDTGVSPGEVDVNDEMYSEQELLRARDHVSYILSRGAGDKHAIKTLYAAMLRRMNSPEQVKASAHLLSMHSLLQSSETRVLTGADGTGADVGTGMGAMWDENSPLGRCVNTQLDQASAPIVPCAEHDSTCVASVRIALYSTLRGALTHCHAFTHGTKARELSLASPVSAPIEDVGVALYGVPTAALPALYPSPDASQRSTAAGMDVGVGISVAQARALLEDIVMLDMGVDVSVSVGEEEGGEEGGEGEGERGPWDRVLDNDRGVFVSRVSRGVGDAVATFTMKSLNAVLPTILTKATNNTVVRITVQRTLAGLTTKLTETLSKGVLSGGSKHTSVLTTQALTHLLVPAITLPTTTIVARSMTHNPKQDYYCYYCKHNSRYCSYCQHALEYNNYIEHVALYFNRYYNEYFTPFYTTYEHIEQYEHLKNENLDTIAGGGDSEGE